LALDTFTVNGLVYTAVAGAKANNTEFSIDTSDNACATDLADSITQDSRTGTDEAGVDQTGSASTNVVTITADLNAGATGNNIGLSSSNGSRLAVSGSTLTGGVTATVTGITVDGVQVMSGTENFDTSLTITATNIASNITANTSSPDYNAGAAGAIVTITALTRTDSQPNGFVVVSSGAVIATTDVNMASGVDGTPEVTNCSMVCADDDSVNIAYFDLVLDFMTIKKLANGLATDTPTTVLLRENGGTTSEMVSMAGNNNRLYLVFEDQADENLKIMVNNGVLLLP